MTKNVSGGPKTVLRGIIHAYMPCWTTLPPPWGPQRGCFCPERPFWAPRTSPGARIGPDCHCTGWSNWVGCINIMCLGPLRELYCTPRVPKRARFGTRGLLLRPRTSSDSPREPDLVPNGVPTSPMTPIHQHSVGRDVI